MVRRFEDMLVINPGSVGLPFEQVAGETRNPDWAEYAVVETEPGHLRVELRRVRYDVRPAIEAARTSGMPHADWWSAHWTVHR